MGAQATPNGVTQLVAEATRPSLEDTDWERNLLLIDLLNAHPQLVNATFNALRARLEENEPRVALHAMNAAEMLIKNCGRPVRVCAAHPTFLKPIEDHATAKKGNGASQRKALALIQQWGKAFEPLQAELPGYGELLARVQGMGLPFPEEYEDVPVFTPPASHAEAPSPAAASTEGQYQQQQQQARGSPASDPLDAEYRKLNEDLDVVVSRLAGFCSMLKAAASGQSTQEEALLDEHDFVLQVRERLLALIEAGSMGRLREQSFDRVLGVNESAVAVDECFRQWRQTGSLNVSLLPRLRNVPASTPPPPPPAAAPASRAPASNADDLLGLNAMAQGGDEGEAEDDNVDFAVLAGRASGQPGTAPVPVSGTPVTAPPVAARAEPVPSLPPPPGGRNQTSLAATAAMAHAPPAPPPGPRVVTATPAADKRTGRTSGASAALQQRRSLATVPSTQAAVPQRAGRNDVVAAQASPDAAPAAAAPAAAGEEQEGGEDPFAELDQLLASDAGTTRGDTGQGGNTQAPVDENDIDALFAEDDTSGNHARS